MAGLHCARCWEANLQENIQEAPFHIHTFFLPFHIFFCSSEFYITHDMYFYNFFFRHQDIFYSGMGVAECFFLNHAQSKKSSEEGMKKERKVHIKRSTFWRELGRVRLEKQILCANAMGYKKT